MWINKFRHFFILAYIISTSVNTSSQERIINLEVNPIIKNLKLSANISYKSSVDTIDLPFFDDFTTSLVYPDTAFWIDNMAFINTTYAVNCKIVVKYIADFLHGSH